MDDMLGLALPQKRESTSCHSDINTTLVGVLSSLFSRQAICPRSFCLAGQDSGVKTAPGEPSVSDHRRYRLTVVSVTLSPGLRDVALLRFTHTPPPRRLHNNQLRSPSTDKFAVCPTMWECPGQHLWK